jgi:hypothetical protein
VLENHYGQGRRAYCTHCGGENVVGQMAMSIFCRHCRKRLILENYRINTYHAVRMFATCGDIVVEKRGLVNAPIRVQNLTIQGKVNGDVEARGRVEIDGTGELRGNITAAILVVRGGGTIRGYCRIGMP